MYNVKFVISTELIRHKFAKKSSLNFLKERIILFKKFTLISILKQQTYLEFDIWLFCDKSFKDYMQTIEWPEKVKVIYDDGRQALNELDTDYLAIMRTDSDDLLHKNCLQEIRNRLTFDNKMHRLVFYQMFTFDIVNNTLYNRASRTEAPFFANIYPKKLYKNHNYFITTFFGNHRKLFKDFNNVTGFIPPRIKSKTKDKYGGRRICVLNHTNNYSNLRRGIKIKNKKVSIEDLKKIKNFLTSDRTEILEMLKDFNIEYMI